MSKFIGRLVDLGIGRESSRGAGVAPGLWLPKISMSFDDKVTRAMDEAGIGKIVDTDDSFVTTLFAEGDVEAELRDQTFGYLLYNLLGSLSSASFSGAFKHSFSIDDSNSHPSLAFTVVDPNTTEQYRLVMLTSLEITSELDDLVKYTASFMSKRSVASSGTASYTKENKFTKKHLGFKVAANLAGLAAAPAISLKSLALTVEKNTVMDDVLGTAEPEDFLNQQMSIEGEVTLNYEDETWKNYMLNDTKRAVEIAFVNSDTTIGSTNPSLTMRFPYVSFFDWEPNYALDEIVTQTLSFKAMTDLSGGNDAISTCELVNEKASY